jgi:hypothetical protein
VNLMAELSCSARFWQAAQGFIPTKEVAFLMASPSPTLLRTGKGILMVRFFI